MELSALDFMKIAMDKEARDAYTKRLIAGGMSPREAVAKRQDLQAAMRKKQDPLETAGRIKRDKQYASGMDPKEIAKRTAGGASGLGATDTAAAKSIFRRKAGKALAIGGGAAAIGAGAYGLHKYKQRRDEKQEKAASALDMFSQLA